MLNRCTSCILLLFVSLASAHSGAVSVILQALKSTSISAGCHITVGDQSRSVMTAAFRSIETGNASTDVALAGIVGVGHPLDRVDQSRKLWVFRGPDLTIKLEGMTEIEPICGGSVCEGSHCQPTLSMDYKGERASLDARAHCGA